MENRKCKKCLEEKEIDNFPKVKNGKYYSNTCRDCYNKNKRTGTKVVLFSDGENKECSVCGRIKKISDFSNKNGRPSYRCKECHNAWYKEYYAKNNRKIKKNVKKYKDRVGKIALRAAKYGLTQEELEALIEKFNGKCWICKKENWYAVDHDHNCCEVGSCGKCVRGVLCHQCNIVLGHAKDDPDLLQNASNYIRERIGLVL